MEVTESGTEGAAAPEAGTAEGGNSEVSESVEAASQEPTGDRYSVKVGGEDHEVTLDELRSGYQRQSDYTRKTQEIAEQRKQLAQYEALATAFQRDPQGTLEALNEAYAYQPSDKSSGETDWESMDPTEKRIAQIEAQLQSQQAQTARSHIEGEFKSLEDDYGDVDRTAVTQYALKNNVNVVDAYKLMNWESLREDRQRLAKEQEVLDSKRGAQTVHSGGSAQAGTVVPATNKKMSVREAYVAALKQVRG